MNRQQTRQVFFEVWQKVQQNQLMIDPMELTIAEIIQHHPEYHGQLSIDKIDADFTPEQGQSNPFLHMGLHISIREQLSIDQPPGIKKVFAQLLKKCGDQHQAEHMVMDCLGEVMWMAQRNQQEMDARHYLECIKAKF